MSRRILLIEPDRPLAETYRQALAAAGHEVVPCASAQAAILAADQRRPDIVIMEMQLVEHSGIEFLYEFRSYPEWQAVPVVVHSLVPPGELSANSQILRRDIGIAKYLYKPLTSLNQLVKAVEGLAVARA